MKNGKVTYEAAIPAAAFGQDSFKQGDKLGFNVCVNIGSEAAGNKERYQLEWSQGCGGSKDATKFAKVTLGEQIKVPVATTAATTKAAATTAAKAATTAAKTADASVIIAAVAVVALAGVVVCKKKH